ncbi:putative alpha-galactosidase C [Aspergillus parasiticus]
MVGFLRNAAVAARLLALFSHCPSAGAVSNAVVADGTSFALNGDSVSYRFHVDNATGDLLSDHYGGSVTGPIPTEVVAEVNGWVTQAGRVRREFPDVGRGDFRTPAIRIRQTEGYTVSDLQYQSHSVKQGKPPLAGLPATFGTEDEVTTLVIHLYDHYSDVAANLSYSVFPKYNAIVRSVEVTNQGKGNITIESLASLSVDFPFEDMDMISLRGDWARESHPERRKVKYGMQSFGSSAGYSSHLHNPFLALMHPSSTESSGEVWGFSLIYSGSFSVGVEKGSQGTIRAMLGLNPDQLSWPLAPGETLTSPECLSVYSDQGIGGMSRSLHRLYRNNFIKSKYATTDRPVLLNSWEGLGFDYNQTTIYELAQETAELGAKMFVLDDGWFGKDYPRVSDNAGLGDWLPNPTRFPEGLTQTVNEITALKITNSSANLRFGLWFEPEMVNPNSTLYHQHPDWVLHAGSYPRTLTRNQLVLNLALPEVQDFIINSVSNILNSADISYVKWDNNRGIHEMPSPSTDHEYVLGMYRVFNNLTQQFPNVLWEGCASGGGRFDPGVLQYFPQIWTSDDTDAVERIAIQLGTSLAYPPSAMGAHISAVPNQQTGRTVSISFRGHVAMMGGSFGLELNPPDMPAEDRAALPGLIALAEKVNPIILTGDMYRLNLPEDSNWPAVLFVSEDGSKAVLFHFQINPNVNHAIPWVKMQGLDPQATYAVEGKGIYTGSVLMKIGLQFPYTSDYGSNVVFLEKQG